MGITPASINQNHAQDRVYNTIHQLGARNHPLSSVVKVGIVATAFFGIVTAFLTIPPLKALFVTFGVLTGTIILLKVLQRCVIDNQRNHRYHPHWRWSSGPARSGYENHDRGGYLPPYPPRPPTPPRHVPVGGGHVPSSAPRGGSHVTVGGGHGQVPQPTARGGHVQVGGGHTPRGGGGNVSIVNTPSRGGGNVPIGGGRAPSPPSGGSHVAVGRGHVFPVPNSNGANRGGGHVAVGRGH